MHIIRPERVKTLSLVSKAKATVEYGVSEETATATVLAGDRTIEAGESILKTIGQVSKFLK